jgi:hypothetical protein
MTPRPCLSSAASGVRPAATSLCTRLFNSVNCALVAPRAIRSRIIAEAFFGGTFVGAGGQAHNP